MKENLPLISVSGDNHAIGKALGVHSRAAYHDVVENLQWFKKLKKRWAGSPELAKMLAASRKYFPQYVRELEGMAEGLKAPFEDLFLWNCRGDLPLGNTKTEDECTTILMAPDSRMHPALIAHNEDYDPHQAPHCFLVEVEQEDGPDIFSFSYPGTILGHTFGVNDYGLVQTCNNVRWPYEPKQDEPLPRYLIARAVLDCATLEEARDLITDQKRAGAFHHSIGHALSKRIWSVEATAKGSSVIDVTDKFGHANHLVHRALQHVGDKVVDNSQSRQDRIEEMLEDAKYGPKQSLKILFDQANRDHPVYRRGGLKDKGYTIATALFALSPDRVAWEVYDDRNVERLRHGQMNVRHVDEHAPRKKQRKAVP